MAVRYFKDLDGLRALAVTMVLLHHARWLPFGWIGVQMFFVLSGFLITNILGAQREHAFSDYVGRFYWKRSLRIWPLYFLFIALCAAAYLYVRIPETFQTAWPFLASYTYNFARMSPGFVESDFFGHFWTLCIEEQFYLLWPFVVYFVPTSRFRSFTFGLIAAGPAIRFLTHLLCSTLSHDPHVIQRAVHNFPTSHFDAFACGALLASLSADERRRLAPNATRILFGLIALTIACGLGNSFLLARQGLPPHWLSFGYEEMAYLHQSVWSYSLLNLASAALIFCLIEQRFLTRVFQNRLVVYVGVISYGIYLWHLPIYHLLGRFWIASPHSASGIIRVACYVAITILVASASYFGFERFFLKQKDSGPRQIIAALSRVAQALFLPGKRSVE